MSLMLTSCQAIVTPSATTTPLPTPTAIVPTWKDSQVIDSSSQIIIPNETQNHIGMGVIGSGTALDSDTRWTIDVQVDNLVQDVGEASTAIILTSETKGKLLQNFIIAYQKGKWSILYQPDHALPNYPYQYTFENLTNPNQHFELSISVDGKTISLKNDAGFEYHHTLQEKLFEGAETIMVNTQIGPQTQITLSKLIISQLQKDELEYSQIESTTPTPTLVPMENFIQGISFPSYFNGDYSRPYSKWILENVIKSTGANWIGVHFFCWMDNYKSTEITCGTENLTTKSDIENIVKVAHNLGFRVFMEMDTGLRHDPDHWTGDIGTDFDEELWEVWFGNYEQYITEYAALAEELNIDMFSIGSELNGTQHREKEWRNVAKSVREVYSGPILYSPDASMGENWLDIKWWDAVDIIGIHPYDTPLSTHNDPTVDEMVTNLRPVIDRLETLSEEFDRPVIITELGIHSMDGISRGMGILWDPNFTYKVDLQEQADVYQAIMQAFQDEDWWEGIFWFYCDLMGNSTNVDSSPFGKPAENIIRSFYGVPTQPAPTPIPTPDLNEMDHHYIFIDDLQNGWSYWPPQDDLSLLDINEHNISASGIDIEVVLDPYNDLRFSLPNKIDLSDFQWLAFDIYSESGEVWDPSKQNYHPVILNVLLMARYSIATPFSVNITSSSPYIEGGQLIKQQWQHVLIPLDAFGPVLIPLQDIAIRNLSPNTIKIYVDNVELVANSREQLK